jgi:putative alpha-1,2-mannosidase
MKRREFIKNVSVAGAAIALPSFSTNSCRGQTAAAGRLAGTRLRPVDCVNPLIGTAPITDKDTIGNNPSPGEQLYTGTVNPGAQVPDPIGNLEVGPVSRYEGRGGHMMGSRYRYEDGTIMGFTHFNAEYSRNNFLLFMPTVGSIKTSPGRWSSPPAEWGYRSAKDDSKEKASAGYYTVFLTTFGIKVELTATKNGGFHRYTFPASQQANVLRFIRQVCTWIREVPEA